MAPKSLEGASFSKSPTSPSHLQGSPTPSLIKIKHQLLTESFLRELLNFNGIRSFLKCLVRFPPNADAIPTSTLPSASTKVTKSVILGSACLPVTSHLNGSLAFWRELNAFAKKHGFVQRLNGFTFWSHIPDWHQIYLVFLPLFPPAPQSQWDHDGINQTGGSVKAKYELGHDRREMVLVMVRKDHSRVISQS